MFSQRNSRLGAVAAILALAHILPLITTALSLPSFYGDGVPGAVPGNGYVYGNRLNFNRFNPSKAKSFFYGLPAWMFDDNAGVPTADYAAAAADDDEAIDAAFEDLMMLSGGAGQQQQQQQREELVGSSAKAAAGSGVGGADDQQKRSLASKLFLRPARSSIQACSRRLLGLLENACRSRNTIKRSHLSTANPEAAESSTWANSAADASKERPKRNLIESCCRSSCSRHTLLSYCHYVGY